MQAVHTAGRQRGSFPSLRRRTLSIRTSSAEKYEYGYVPTCYIEGIKEAEGDITKDGMRKVLDKALSL